MTQKGVPYIKMFSFFIGFRPKTAIMNATTFEYSLHELRETIDT